MGRAEVEASPTERLGAVSRPAAAFLVAVTSSFAACIAPTALEAAAAAEETASRSEALLDTSTSWNGGPIAFPDGAARVISSRVELDEGASTPWHCHTVPMFAYVVAGTVEVHTVAGERRRFAAGESMAEVVRTWHRGRSVDGPVEIVVFFAASEGVEPTIVAESGEAPDARTPCAASAP
ncbi:MAG: cupin domain-containing protein [Acidobacteria bacterium]|nr:MAG: cupin domain-containing protein [Acidobacteriota bacterium]REK07772.1 MAG: cupin domain-containing protein [Acidobacteriota bacterium]